MHLADADWEALGVPADQLEKIETEWLQLQEKEQKRPAAAYLEESCESYPQAVCEESNEARPPAEHEQWPKLIIGDWWDPLETCQRRELFRRQMRRPPADKEKQHAEFRKKLWSRERRCTSGGVPWANCKFR